MHNSIFCLVFINSPFADFTSKWPYLPFPPRPKAERICAHIDILTLCCTHCPVCMSGKRVDNPRDKTFNKVASLLDTPKNNFSLFGASEKCECGIGCLRLPILPHMCCRSGDWCLLLTEASDELSVNSLVNPEDLFVASDISSCCLS